MVNKQTFLIQGWFEVTKVSAELRAPGNKLPMSWRPTKVAFESAGKTRPEMSAAAVAGVSGSM